MLHPWMLCIQVVMLAIMNNSSYDEGHIKTI